MSIAYTGEFYVPDQVARHVEEDHVARYEFARSYVAGKAVLDIACGYGYGAGVLRTADFRRYAGFDINPALVAHAAAENHDERITFGLADITRFVASQPYEVIVCFETIEHVTDYRQALRNLHTALTPDGTLLISTPNREVESPRARSVADKPANPFHVVEFTRSEFLHELTEAGFDEQSLVVYGRRQRRFHSRNRVLHKLRKTLLGDPDQTAAPDVPPVGSQTPKLFVVVAHKAPVSAM